MFARRVIIPKDSIVSDVVNSLELQSQLSKKRLERYGYEQELKKIHVHLKEHFLIREGSRLTDTIQKNQECLANLKNEIICMIKNNNNDTLDIIEKCYELHIVNTVQQQYQKEYDETLSKYTLYVTDFNDKIRLLEESIDNVNNIIYTLEVSVELCEKQLNFKYNI
jgi:hypothetical protein